MAVDKELDHNQPNIVALDRESKTAQILDIAVPYETNAISKTVEKIKKYRDLEIVLKKNWRNQMIQTISVVE
eukprot:3758949-Ditylum_brightwellii.AAC.1